ncbi:hypothetical protein MUP77_07645 [Candidatus Bathyarchaeota archaeon]|nr:hypothetical protein [Candidatus Bathyarchaeota archaeon]
MMKRKYRTEGYKCPLPNCGTIFPTPQSLGGHVTSQHTGADLDWIIAHKEDTRRLNRSLKVALNVNGNHEVLQSRNE